MTLGTLPDGLPVVLRRAAIVATPLALLVLLGGHFLAAGPGPRPLSASNLNSVDSDRDGLPDRQEIVLGTDPLLVDSDFDGYSDGEEFALQTDPTAYDDAPDALGLSVAMSARGEGGKLKLFTVVHTPAPDLDGVVLRVGALLGRKMVELPLHRLAPHSSSTTQSAPNGGTLLVIDLDLPEAAVQLYGSATFFAAVGREGDAHYAAAAKADLLLIDGVMVLRHPAKPSGGPSAVNGGSYVMMPIPPDGDEAVPIDWKPGEICFQLSEVTGTVGNTVVHEVVHAACESGWDTYCESDCAATENSTFTTVDPGSLLGG